MLIDTHCHLDFEDFDEERDQIVQRAVDAGVKQMITISTRLKKFDRISALAEKYDQVFCSVGVHPNNAHEEPDITAGELVELSSHPKCVAIGEAGLDYFYDYAPPAVQAKGLRQHIKAARITGLPLVIHARAADDDMIAILREAAGEGSFPFLLHCFSSGAELARVGVELGGYVSFSGILTFPKSEDIREIARQVPRERLLVETDAPYLAPKKWRGKRNEPSYVVNTAEVLAEAIGVTSEEIAAITTENAFRCFAKMPRVAA